MLYSCVLFRRTNSALNASDNVTTIARIGAFGCSPPIRAPLKHCVCGTVAEALKHPIRRLEGRRCALRVAFAMSGLFAERCSIVLFPYCAVRCLLLVCRVSCRVVLLSCFFLFETHAREKLSQYLSHVPSILEFQDYRKPTVFSLGWFVARFQEETCFRRRKLFETRSTN